MDSLFHPVCNEMYYFVDDNMRVKHGRCSQWYINLPTDIMYAVIETKNGKETVEASRLRKVGRGYFTNHRTHYIG